VNRRPRFVVPLILGGGLLALYFFVKPMHDVPRPALDALRFVAYLLLVLALVRLVDFLFFGLVASRRSIRAPQLLRDFISIALFAICFAWALNQVYEYNVTAVLATGTVVAAVLGLALQETLGNLFSGISLHLEDSFSPGDVIRSGDHFGIVEAVRWRGTRLRTFNNNVVIVPNSMLARERLEVFPRNNFNARVLQLGIDYHVPPATVITVLTQAASNVEGVVREMPCIARVAAFGESSMTYEVKYFTADYALRDRIDAEIRKAVWYALQRNGIPIATPIRAMHNYQAPAPRQHPGQEEILERLAGIDVLSPIERDALQSIALAARVHVFSKGETILRRDAEGDSMFVVHEGGVSVRTDGGEVARLTAGDFFGEMALLTGERRTADVVAVTDVVTIEIAKDALQPVLHDHPDLAAAISAKVMERRGDAADARREREPAEEQGVLAKIKAYFGL
jgi:small-conductance mechanosensitive channel/CRP-like cAMP-binding protein